jgi:hypothetical protein
MTPTPRSLPARAALSLAIAAAVALLALLMAGRAQADFSNYDFSEAAAEISSANAGAHADFTTYFHTAGTPFEQIEGDWRPWQQLRNFRADLPPGFTGAQAAFPECDTAIFLTLGELCPTDSQIGVIDIHPYNFSLFKEPVYNMVPPANTNVVARFGFYAFFFPGFIDIRLDPDRENALTAEVVDLPALAEPILSKTTIWGVPSDPSNDDERLNPIEAAFCGFPCLSENGSTRPAEMPPTAFMSNPTSCGPKEVGMSLFGYSTPGEAPKAIAPLPEITNCDQVPFEPTLDLKPTTPQAGASSGVDLRLTVPQPWSEDPNTPASAHLKKAVLTLPEGVGLNASSAAGLGSCSQTQMGVEPGETQTIAIGNRGAPVSLSFNGESTPLLPDRATAAQVQGALEALPSLAPGDVQITGGPGGPWTVKFVGSLAGQDVPEISGTGSEVQQVSVLAKSGPNGFEPPAGGTFTLSFEGDTTGPLPFDASAATVQAALEGLPGIAPGDVVVSEGPASTDVFRVAFTGALGATDVPSITADGSLLHGTQQAFASVQVLVDGGGELVDRTPKQGGVLSFDGSRPTCPNSSKVGSGEIVTPVLHHPLHADLYLAKQDDNPFNSLLAGYLVAQGDGVLLKVAGKFELDPGTGRIVASFDNNPQQPFTEMVLHLKGGNRGVITTPSKCGTYDTEYELTPWSGTAPVVGTSQFTIDQNCGVDGTFAPTFKAGSSNPLAGAFSPFVLQVTREAGTQRLAGMSVDPPPGLTAKLAGVPYCPDATLAAISGAPGSGAAQAASPSCPAASQVGRSVVGAGSGSPFYLDTGKVYLAGPYRGAPVSLAIVTPAVAGPFDLGSVVVRAATSLDPATVRVHTVSDPLPTILQGIPLDLRDVRVILDRPGFVLNPTNCEPMTADGTILGAAGASVSVSDRYQVGECAALGFKPKLSLRLKGGTTRRKHPALTAVLRPRSGDANISRISVALPHSEFLDQAHIGTVCTRVQFAADNCPAASIYGKVTATTPLLDYPLTGNVYLRSSSHKLPDLVTDLRGVANQPIKIEAAGRIDSVRGGLRTTFDFVPDAPLTKVVLSMYGGKKGLLVNSRDICAKPYEAQVQFNAHNGREVLASPRLHAKCHGASRGKHRRSSHRGGK